MAGGDANPYPSAEELAFLDIHGGVSGVAESPRRRAAAVPSEMSKDPMVTVAHVAASLGLPAGAVRRSLREGGLYAHPAAGPDGGPQLPLWQFRDGQVVPQLAAVLARLPVDFTYAEVRAFALHAEIDDPSGEVTAPLIDWLADGGDPGPALDLAASQALAI